MGKISKTAGASNAGVSLRQQMEPLIGLNTVIKDGLIELFCGMLQVISSTTSDIILGARTSNDAHNRLQLKADGRMEWGSGSVTPNAALYRDSNGALHATASLVTDGNLQCDLAGGGIRLKEGSNACIGVATLVGGSVTINTNKVTADSRIFLTHQSAGGTLGFLRVSARVAGTSFTVVSANVLDTSSVAWMIIEPVS